MKGVGVQTNFFQWFFKDVLEVLDARELRYTFALDKDFEQDMRNMMFRYHKLKEVGPISEANRFPYSRQDCNELIIFNRSYSSRIEDMLLVWKHQPIQANFWKAAKDENEFLYHAWDALRDAKTEFYYIEKRREGLQKLKAALDNIDPSWYTKGMMPPHVPTWRFVEVK